MNQASRNRYQTSGIKTALLLSTPNEKLDEPGGDAVSAETKANRSARQQRRWLLVLLVVPGMILLLLLGVVAWGWIEFRHYQFGRLSVWYGYTRNTPKVLSVTRWKQSPSRDEGDIMLSIPDFLGGGDYEVFWDTVK